MFKIGDNVFCIDNHDDIDGTIHGLDLDVIYEVYDVARNFQLIKLKGFPFWLDSNRFVLYRGRVASQETKPVSGGLRMIWVKFQKEGVHKYPAALTDPKLESVSFLGYPHRHQFHFKVHIQVFHDDRDIEFIMFKRELEGLYDSKVLELDYKSCEMMADDLAKYLQTKYPGRKLQIDVSEDGENGCACVYPVEEKQ